MMKQTTGNRLLPGATIFLFAASNSRFWAHIRFSVFEAARSVKLAELLGPSCMHCVCGYLMHDT
jgi:hypothetical protein